MGSASSEPKAITADQIKRYRELHAEAITALGLDPRLVVLNGVRWRADRVSVETIVPPDGWETEAPGPYPAVQDPEDPSSILTRIIWIPIAKEAQ